MKILKIILFTITLVVVSCGIGFAGRMWGLWNFSFFAPKYENARREVFENSQSYVEGKRQELTKKYDEWLRSDEQGKATIRIIVMLNFANFNQEHLSYQHIQMYNEIVNHHHKPN